MEIENEKGYCTLYLVRHGETEWNVQKINQGQSESPLTENGIRQAGEAAEKLKNVNFEAIFSSDLSRAHRTAEIIKLDRDIIIETSKLLRERSHGSFEGKHFEVLENELKEKMEEREKLSEDEYHSFRLAPDIETDEELMQRFFLQLREIAIAYPDKSVLVVTHAGCIKNFLIKTGYSKRKDLTAGAFKNGGYIKVLSDGVNFFIKEAEGIQKITGVKKISF